MRLCTGFFLARIKTLSLQYKPDSVLWKKYFHFCEHRGIVGFQLSHAEMEEYKEIACILHKPEVLSASTEAGILFLLPLQV